MKYTFSGGIKIEEQKNTKNSRIELVSDVRVVSIPLLQHIGVAATPVVSKGEYVTIGQKIGDVPEEMLGCPVHSSISGTVRDIVKKLSVNGNTVDHVIIENDMKNTLSPDIRPVEKKLIDTTPEEVIELIRKSGVVGMGGAAFPTYAKIRSAVGKVNKLIVNCAECEPFITANHRLLLERPAAVINGIKVLLKTIGITTAYIALEDNKLDAAEKLKELLAESRTISVKIMKTKYPQGDERQLIYALCGIEIPQGKLPSDVGCVIFNAETCAAVYNAFSAGMPLVSRVVTVDGDAIREPKNLLVPIGTSVSDLINHCGGLKKIPNKIINGGPMMGVSQWDTEMPVTKATGAVLVFSKDFGKKHTVSAACIRCGKCVMNCPMHLMPMYIAQFSTIGDFTRAEEYGALSCVECGSCSYNCPGGVEIVQYIRLAKSAIRNEKLRSASASSKAKI